MGGPAKLEVSPAVVEKAKRRWDVAADALDAAWRRLHKAETGQLSPAVVTAIGGFREPWVDEIKSAAEQAQRCSDEIPQVTNLVYCVDEEHARRLRDLLPWSERGAEISSGPIGPVPQSPGGRP